MENGFISFNNQSMAGIVAPLESDNRSTLSG